MENDINALVYVAIDMAGWEDSLPAFVLLVPEQDNTIQELLNMELGEWGVLPDSPWCPGDELAIEEAYFRGLVPLYVPQQGNEELITLLMDMADLQEMPVLNHMNTSDPFRWSKALEHIPVIRDWNTCDFDTGPSCDGREGCRYCPFFSKE